MTTLVLYDSQFGNTEKIAQAIGKGIGGDVQVRSAKELEAIGWYELKLLVVGTPTQGGRPTPALQKLFEAIPADGLKGAKVAAFDTRFREKDHNFALRALMKTIGYASVKMVKILEAKGGTLIAQPQGFFVTDKQGPLVDGEIDRAEQWGTTLAQL